MKECVDTEDKEKPYTDDELAETLKTKGYPIARRTMIGGKSKVAVRLDMLGCAHVDMPIGYVERINF